MYVHLTTMLCDVRCVLQLLDLMHTLHTKAAAIFTGWAQEAEAARAAVDSSSHGSMVTVDEISAGTSTLWMTCWCPLLQGDASCFIHCY